MFAYPLPRIGSRAQAWHDRAGWEGQGIAGQGRAGQVSEGKGSAGQTNTQCTMKNILVTSYEVLENFLHTEASGNYSEWVRVIPSVRRAGFPGHAL